MADDDNRNSPADRRRSVSTSHPSAGGSSSAMTGENVKIVCRVRPFNNREYELQEEMNAKLPEYERRPLRSVISMTKNTTQFLDHNNDYSVKEEFRFDENIWSIPPEQQVLGDPDVVFADQAYVFERVGRVTLSNAFSGYNTCIFAYGQTGSGKTFTMMGFPQDKGLTPRCCEELFREIQKKEQEDHRDPAGLLDIQSIKWDVDARYLEIYNEHVKDLLWQLSDPATQGQYDKDNLKVRNIPGQGPYVVGLTVMPVQSWDECDAIMNAGMQNRVVAATKMNDNSSRSHAVFRLTIKQTTTLRPAKQYEKPKVLERVATINLVDLAGSERLKKSGAQGVRLKEAAAINLSLTTLKNVIDALVEQRPLIPYRDSQLTWLLSDSLGGNSKTFMIACLSPHLDNAEETLNTMRYALRTQGIVNHAKVNESDEARRIADLQRELAEAQKALAGGADGTKNQLQKEMNEKLAMLNELEETHHNRQAMEQQLLANIEKDRAAQERAIYVGCFHQVFVKRIAERLAKAKDQLNDMMTQVGDDISRTNLELTQVEVEHSRILAAEERIKTSVKRAERDHSKKHQEFNEATEQLRKLQEEIGRLEERLRKARIRRNVTLFFITLHHGIHRKRHITQTDEINAQYTQELHTATRQGQTERTAIASQHDRHLKRVQKEMETIKEESNSVTQSIQSTNDDRKMNVRRLNEDITFFERENRNLDDERVQRVTELERQANQKYQAESTRLSERSVKSRQLLENTHARFMRENAFQIKKSHTEHEETLKGVSEQWGNRLANVQQQAENAVREQAKYYAGLLSDHDSQIEDARVFLHQWRHNSRQYDAAHREILAMMKQHKNTKDPELRELISMMEASVVQTARMPAMAQSPSPTTSPRVQRPATTPGSTTPSASRTLPSGTSKGLMGGRLGSRRPGGSSGRSLSQEGHP